jgi:glycerophosphoryl diester phosphodiesterase
MSRLVRMLMLALVVMSAMTVVPAEVVLANVASITGRIIEKGVNTGNAVVGIEVCAVRRLQDQGTNQSGCNGSARTDANGRFRISGLNPSSHLVFAIPPSDDMMIIPSVVEVLAQTTPPDATATFLLTKQVPTPSKTEEIAHRGDRVSSPENTRTAIDRAIKKGATHIEIDVLLASDNSVVLAHGSTYQNEPPNAVVRMLTNPVTQVYGPTSVCFNRNLEQTSALGSMLSDCDIGSEMMILPGNGLGQTWNPKFRNERYQRLEQVLRAFPQYCGWMIELKPSEHPDLSSADKLDRDFRLGVAVTQLLQRIGVLDRCGDRVWVTSFSDAALGAVTDPRIQRMRTISSLFRESFLQDLALPSFDLAIPPVAQWNWSIERAAFKDYDGVNLPVQSLDTPIYRDSAVIVPPIPFVSGITARYGPTIIDYARRAGLRVSAYSLTGIEAFFDFPSPFEMTPELNQRAIDLKADFFMTDILDDMQARNGDRKAPNLHGAVLLNDFKPGPDKAIIQSQEVYTSEVNPRALTSASERFLLTKFTLPAQGVVALSRPSASSASLTQHFTVPRYADNNYTPTYQSYTTTATLSSQARTALDGGQKLEVGGNHAVWTNVDPILWLGKDDVTFKANGVEFPDANGADRAVVGIVCSATTVKGINFEGKLKPATGWAIRAMTFKIDDTVIGTYSGAAIPERLLSATNRDLQPGNHTFKIEATLFYDNVLYSQDTNNPSDDITRVEVYEQPFEAKLKPCLNGGDLALVFDSSGSISTENFGLMKSFGVSLTNGLTVSTTATNIGIVNYDTSAVTVLGLNGNPATVRQAILAMMYRGGSTATGDAITRAQAVLAAGRPSNPNIMIVLTDGNSNTGTSVSTAAAAAKAAGTTVIAVGIGNSVSFNELNTIASTPGYVFTPNTFGDLVYVLEALLPASADPIP